MPNLNLQCPGSEKDWRLSISRLAYSQWSFWPQMMRTIENSIQVWTEDSDALLSAPTGLRPIARCGAVPPVRLPTGYVHCLGFAPVPDTWAQAALPPSLSETLRPLALDDGGGRTYGLHRKDSSVRFLPASAIRHCLSQRPLSPPPFPARFRLVAAPQPLQERARPAVSLPLPRRLAVCSLHGPKHPGTLRQRASHLQPTAVERAEVVTPTRTVQSCPRAEMGAKL